jgi:Cysteine rich repeat
MKKSAKKSIHVAAALVAQMLPLAAASLASAQSGPSVQEQMACRSDAAKFCAEHVGKPPQMNACLKANKTNLSDACRKVVESRGS